MSQVKPGDIAYVRFPMHDASTLAHPALILEVQETLDGRTRVRCAYGTSKRVEACRDYEFAISESDGRAFQVSGLRKATRFDLSITAWFLEPAVDVIGVMHPSLYSRFRQAARALKV